MNEEKAGLVQEMEQLRKKHEREREREREQWVAMVKSKEEEYHHLEGEYRRLQERMFEDFQKEKNVMKEEI